MPSQYSTPEEAAIKIQATYRGYSTRKHLQEEMSQASAAKPKTSCLCQTDPNLAVTKVQATYRGYKARKELEKLSPAFGRMSLDHGQSTKSDLSNISNTSTVHEENKVERLNRAATRIQAAYRGYRLRSHLDQVDKSDASSTCCSPNLSEDEAATKIQAAFRGYRVRKNFRSQTVPIPRFDDQKYEEAATKIQTIYRGYRVRKEVGPQMHNQQHCQHHHQNEGE